MESINAIVSRARALVSGSTLELDQAIHRAIDEAFESGIQVDQSLSEKIRAQLMGLGSLDELVQDPGIEEIWINSPTEIFISRSAKTERLALTLTELELRQVVERMLRESGRKVDRAEPFVDATLANGSRLHVVIPDVTSKYWAVNIRKFPTHIYTLKDLVFRGSMSMELANYLEQSFRSGINILVSGATQAGKTTMLCALLDVGKQTDRLISIEETFEIRTDYQDWVALQARSANLEGVGEITLRRLVREALRMRPGRLVIGEVRQAEALDLLIALNSGIAGLCTIHANSAQEALAKLKLLPLLAGENIPAKFVEETVDSTIGLVVHCQMQADGSRRVSEVLRSEKSPTGTSWHEVLL